MTNEKKTKDYLIEAIYCCTMCNGCVTYFVNDHEELPRVAECGNCAGFRCCVPIGKYYGINSGETTLLKFTKKQIARLLSDFAHGLVYHIEEVGSYKTILGTKEMKQLIKDELARVEVKQN